MCGVEGWHIPSIIYSSSITQSVISSFPSICGSRAPPLSPCTSWKLATPSSPSSLCHLCHLWSHGYINMYCSDPWVAIMSSCFISSLASAVISCHPQICHLPSLHLIFLLLAIFHLFALVWNMGGSILCHWEPLRNVDNAVQRAEDHQPTITMCVTLRVTLCHPDRLRI